jgi:hypothetical protein
MTLKETLQDYLHEPYATECEQLADEFAIGFAIWILVNQDTIVSIEYDTPEEAIKNLLEIYKKEKGL